MAEKIQTAKIICKGGLNSLENWVDLSDNFPGYATELINFEPSLSGGYRRINGFVPLETDNPIVDPSGAEGKILGLIIYNDKIYAARKQIGSLTYCIYERAVGGPWVKLTLGFTLNSTGVSKVRFKTFNFDGTETLVFVDGVNFATLFDGTNWTQIKSTNSGADFANAGGDQALDAPKYVTVYKNHVFYSGDATYPHVVCHSAPNDAVTMTAAAGGGQLNAGFPVVQIKPWRDSNFVFGVNSIKRIDVNGTNFVINDVTNNLGCIASDSIVELNGDLIFLSQDGFRPVSATVRNEDLELSSISKLIQNTVYNTFNFFDLDAVSSVVLRKKSQVRFFVAQEGTPESLAGGFIVGLMGAGDGVRWEWGQLRGIKASCAVSDYINGDEIVLHGGYDGGVYQQEFGNSFNGENIFAFYATPYLDFDDPLIRKTMRSMHIFCKPEGPISLKVGLTYDWGSVFQINPADYNLESEGDVALWGEAIWDEDTYNGAMFPILITNISGSGKSVKFNFMSNDTQSSYSIQSILLEISFDGRD